MRARVPAGEALPRRCPRDRGATQSPELAEALEDIVACEAVLAPAAMCFSYLSQQDRTPVARSLTAGRALRAGRDVAGAPLARSAAHHRCGEARVDRGSAGRRGTGEERWLLIAEALHDKDFDRLVRLLIEQNTAVSATAAPTPAGSLSEPTTSSKCTWPTCPPGCENRTT